MQISDFPILTAACATGRSRSGGPARVLTNLETAIAFLNAGGAAGEIANQNFISAKDSVNRALESAWESIRDFDVMSSHRRRQAGTRMPEKTEAFFDAFMYPQAHTAAGALKRLDKVPADPAVDSLRPLLVEIQPLCAAIQSLKDKVVKRQPRTEEERQAAIYVPPVATTKAAALAQSILEEIAQDAFERLVAQFTDYNLKTLADYRLGQEAALADPSLMRVEKYDRTPSYSIAWHFTDKSEYKRGVNMARVQVLNRYVTDRNPITFVADIETKLREDAVKDADHIRKVFVVKNLKKIVAILDAKGDDNFLGAEKISYEISLAGLEGNIRFTFKDGSRFDVKNSVVFVQNSYGTQFNRFPLTFHNVVMPNGQPMKSPSEKRMNEVFAA
jgi:hypothetical protein